MVEVSERQKLITHLLCFSMLTNAQSLELAELMEEKNYTKWGKIVEEDAIVESVYIIVEGKAEVTRLVPISKKKFPGIKQKTKIVPLAVLRNGEAIGLNDTGFFSTTGKRTATVTAITPLSALYLDLKKLHQFLQNHKEVSKKMLDSAEQMLRIRLIKQSLPFSNLSHERLLQLANKVVMEEYKSGTIIFNEGDPGDRCYLIYSGKVQILAKNDKGEEHELAVLTPPTLFGEATLITRAPRNATAKAIENSRLLMLKHDYLSELIESEHKVASMFMTLMVDRSRPIQNPHAEAHERTTADEQPVVILKNPDNGSYFKLSHQGWFVWEQLNGQQTMQEVTIALAEKHNIFAPEVVAGLISKLTQTGFVTNVKLEVGGHNVPMWKKVLRKVRGIFSFRYAFGDADKWLTKLYNKFGFLIFSLVGKTIIGSLILIGILAFAFSVPFIITVFRAIHDAWLLTAIIPIMLISVVFHELGHALATKSYGHEVHYMGVGLSGLSPIAFVDTSDMWLQQKRWPRIFVNLAGIFSDTLGAGIASILIWVVSSHYLQVFLWLYALFTYLNAFKMLNPLQDYDGYYVLMDYFDKPKLRRAAIVWLAKEFPKAFKKQKVFKKHKAEVTYWIVCFLFIVSISALTLFIQTVLFGILGFTPSRPSSVLLAPIATALAALWAVVVEFRSDNT